MKFNPKELLNEPTRENHEEYHFWVPKGTGNAIEKKYGKKSKSRIGREGLYKMLIQK